MSDELGKLKRDINLGWDAEDFLRSNLGVFLCERAESEREDLLEAIITVDPESASEIRRIQTRIAVLDAWQGWIAEAVSIGNAAQAEMKEMDNRT